MPQDHPRPRGLETHLGSNYGLNMLSPRAIGFSVWDSVQSLPDVLQRKASESRMSIPKEVLEYHKGLYFRHRPVSIGFSNGVADPTRGNITAIEPTAQAVGTLNLVGLSEHKNTERAR